MTTIYNRPDGKNRFQIRSAAKLTLPSAWLDQEFNLIYGILNGLTISDTVSASEWTSISGSYTQDSTTSFSVSGDLTSVFSPLRGIQFTDNNETTYDSHIQSSTYDSGTDTTTVVVYDTIVPATITKVAVGLISSESATIPSSNVVLKNNNYTVRADDKIVLVNDSMSYSGTLIYDDGQVGGDGYPAILITLPQPSALPNKLLCVKKVAGEYKTIVSSTFSHSSALNDDNELVHTNTYDFQILGDTTAKNRVTLEGIGDCYWFISNGTNWYELTPEASETVKGLVRFANDEEMTLSAQQIADDETLRKDLAVSPFNLDAHYLRTDASNMRFSSNYIYQAPNGVAALVNNNIVVYNGLGLNIPTGRDENGVITTKKIELDNNLNFAPVEVTDKLKLMFVAADSTLQPILAENYYIGYSTPTPANTQVGDVIIWFDFSSNLLKESTDNGANWTTFDGAGPICEFYGNGVNITNITPYASVGFLTRDELQNLYQTVLNNSTPDYSSGVSITNPYSTPFVADYDGIVVLYMRQNNNTVKVSINGVETNFYSQHSNVDLDNVSLTIPVAKHDSLTLNINPGGEYSGTFYPYKGALK